MEKVTTNAIENPKTVWKLSVSWFDEASDSCENDGGWGIYIPIRGRSKRNVS